MMFLTEDEVLLGKDTGQTNCARY